MPSRRTSAAYERPVQQPRQYKWRRVATSQRTVQLAGAQRTGRLHINRFSESIMMMTTETMLRLDRMSITMMAKCETVYHWWSWVLHVARLELVNVWSEWGSNVAGDTYGSVGCSWRETSGLTETALYVTTWGCSKMWSGFFLKRKKKCLLSGDA